MENPKFSVIIPTLNRPKDLCRAIQSVLQQTLKPYEIIIIDQSNNRDTAEIIEKFGEAVRSLSIVLIYRPLLPSGLTHARNYAITIASGDYAAFLDDDVILNPDYLEQISRTINKNGALVVQGKITNYYDRYHPLRYQIMRLFRLSSPSDIKGVVYSSFGNVLPVRFNQEIKCMWASGCNHTIRLDVARELKYDENLIAYALGEDVDMTFRAYNLYPQKVWANPKAQLVHMESQQGRIGDQRFIYMEAVHRRYLFQKNIPLTLKNKVIFAWSRLGVFFVSLLRFIQKPGQFNINLLNLRYTIMGEWFAFRNRKRIAKGELGFFHQWFWKEQ